MRPHTDRHTLTCSPCSSASTARATTGTASAGPLLSIRNVLACIKYIHATGVETSLCPAPSCCRAKTSREHTGSGSVCARQCKATLWALCPHQKSPPRWLDQCWDALLVVSSISRLAGLRVSGLYHLCSSRNPLGFLLEAEDLSVSFTDAVLYPWLFNS